MNRNLFVKISAAFCLIIIVTLMLANIGLFHTSSYYQSINDNKTAWFNDQAANMLTETTGIKVQLKLVDVSFADKFFSSEYHKAGLGKQPKLLTIISETFSEINIRNSTFLISESTTST